MATRHSRVNMEGHFDGVHCLIVANSKEARVDYRDS
jgi:hypothetical protein